MREYSRGRGLLQSPHSKHHHPPHPASPSPHHHSPVHHHEPDSTSSAQRSTPLCGACMRALQHPSHAPGRGAPAWLRAAVAQLLRLRGSGGQVDAAACWRGWGGGAGNQRWKRERASCSRNKSCAHAAHQYQTVIASNGCRKHKSLLR